MDRTVRRVRVAALFFLVFAFPASSLLTSVAKAQPTPTPLKWPNKVVTMEPSESVLIKDGRITKRSTDPKKAAAFLKSLRDKPMVKLLLAKADATGFDPPSPDRLGVRAIQYSDKDTDKNVFILIVPLARKTLERWVTRRFSSPL